MKKDQWAMLGIAIKIVAGAFDLKTDMGGKPYLLHCLHVMNQMDQNDPELMQIAVMHDLLEDCPSYTENTLRTYGFSERVIAGVRAMTHDEDEDYLEVYIQRIAKNPDARRVKLEDLKHNSCITRCKSLREKDINRMVKYIRAFEYLK